MSAAAAVVCRILRPVRRAGGSLTATTSPSSGYKVKRPQAVAIDSTDSDSSRTPMSSAQPSAASTEASDKLIADGDYHRPPSRRVSGADGGAAGASVAGASGASKSLGSAPRRELPAVSMDARHAARRRLSTGESGDLTVDVLAQASSTNSSPSSVGRAMLSSPSTPLLRDSSKPLKGGGGGGATAGMVTSASSSTLTARSGDAQVTPPSRQQPRRPPPMDSFGGSDACVVDESKLGDSSESIPLPVHAPAPAPARHGGCEVCAWPRAAQCAHAPVHAVPSTRVGKSAASLWLSLSLSPSMLLCVAGTNVLTGQSRPPPPSGPPPKGRPPAFRRPGLALTVENSDAVIDASANEIQREEPGKVLVWRGGVTCL